MRQLDVIIIAVIVSISGVSLSLADDVNENWTEYQLKEGYSISLPANWIYNSPDHASNNETWAFTNQHDPSRGMQVSIIDNEYDLLCSEETLLELSNAYMENSGYNRIESNLSDSYVRNATNNYYISSLTTGWINLKNEIMVLSMTQEQSNFIIISSVFPSIKSMKDNYDEFLEILGTIKNNSIS